MEDNINQVQPVSPTEQKNKEVDLNFLQKEESIQVGCAVGDHMYRITEMRPAGELTQIFLECNMCGHKAIREERLNVNNMIDPTLPAPQPATMVPQAAPGPQQPYNPPKTEMAPTDVGRLDAFSRLRAEEKASDSFWERIKKGQ